MRIINLKQTINCLELFPKNITMENIVIKYEEIKYSGERDFIEEDKISQNFLFEKIENLKISKLLTYFWPNVISSTFIPNIGNLIVENNIKSEIKNSSFNFRQFENKNHLNGYVFLFPLFSINFTEIFTNLEYGLISNSNFLYEESESNPIQIINYSNENFNCDQNAEKSDQNIGLEELFEIKSSSNPLNVLWILDNPLKSNETPSSLISESEKIFEVSEKLTEKKFDKDLNSGEKLEDFSVKNINSLFFRNNKNLEKLEEFENEYSEEDEYQEEQIPNNDEYDINKIFKINIIEDYFFDNMKPKEEKENKDDLFVIIEDYWSNNSKFRRDYYSYDYNIIKEEIKMNEYSKNKIDKGWILVNN
jgi:hypothetical protein